MMMPVRKISFDATLIPVFKLQGEPIEGEEVVVQLLARRGFHQQDGS